MYVSKYEYQGKGVQRRKIRQTSIYLLWFEVLTTLVMRTSVFSVIMSYNNNNINNSVALVWEEPYQPSNRRLSAKLVPTFADRRVLRSQSVGSPTAVISDF
jgi:hypothetical protein